MLNPLHLRTLTVVLHTGSFAVAARQLGYTPSAVSQQIAALERAARMPLFERDARSVRPTPAASFLAGRGQEVLATLAALQDDVQALAGGTAGTVRLGSFPTASAHLLPAALATLTRTVPGVAVYLDEGEPQELAPQVHDGDLDVALVYAYTRVPTRRPTNLMATPLLREDVLLLLPAGHQWPQQESDSSPATVSLADLRDATWVATRKGTDGATCLERICAEAGFQPQVAFRSNDYAVIRGLVRSGLGIALVPRLGCAPTPGVVTAGLADVVVQRHVEVLSRSEVHNPAVSGVVRALVQVVASLHAPEDGLYAEEPAPGLR
jgi:DNA-binding transcriptional LysR family regulator